jgi:hypothetical protein
MVLVLVLEIRWSSTSTAGAEDEDEYEKPSFPQDRCYSCLFCFSASFVVSTARTLNLVLAVALWMFG